MSGLHDPEEFEPEQGSLQLASPDDDASVADWEKATAAVLRKARRLRDDDPDDLVWDTLTRTTLDGIAVAPIGSRAQAEHATTSGRPTRAGDWDIRAQVTVVDAKVTNEAVLVDLDNGVTSLWLDRVEGVDLAALLDGVLLDLAPVVLDGHGDDPMVAVRAFLDVLGGTTPADGTNLGAAWDDDQLVDLARLALDAGTLAVVVDGTWRARPRRLRRAGARLVAGCGHRRPAHPHRRRHRTRRRAGPAGVPLRRHGRTVPHDRQAARGPPALGPRGRALWLGAHPPAPARGDEPADDERLRPVGQHAAHHRRVLRGRCRRRRLGHRAALRLTARGARRTRSPQSPATPRACSSASPTSPTWPTPPAVRMPWRGSPTTSPTPRGPSWAGSRRTGSTPSTRASPRWSRGATTRSPTGPDRSRGSASSRTSGRRCPIVRPYPAPRQVRRYGAAFEDLRADPADRAGLPRHDGPCRRSTPHGRRLPPTCLRPVA